MNPKTWIKRKVNALVASYGITGTVLIVVGVVALSPVPFPGTSLIPFWLARVLKKVLS